MAKPGSVKRPIVVRVQTEERLHEVASVCAERGWYFVAGLEPDEPEDTSDLDRLLSGSGPVRAEKKPGRNDPCPCGSGKKYKKCCGLRQ